MWRERLIRFLLVSLGAVLIMGAAKTFADWRAKQSPGGGWQLPKVSMEKLPSKNVLGTAKEKILGRKKEQVVQETEPIAEPTENIQKQTQTLIESIKKLPEDQIEAIKKQILKEICEPLLVEEE